MSTYIKRQTAVDIVLRADTIEEAVWQLQAIPALTVVHCKDCEYWHRNNVPIDGAHGCSKTKDYMKPYDYCSSGKRYATISLSNEGADVVEVVRCKGEWIVNDLGITVCSNCNKPRRDNRINHTSFCNSCGADMRGEING